MQLIKSIQLTKEGHILEYKLDNQNNFQILTNATTHIGDEIYKLKKTEKGTVNNRFKIQYSGNKSLIIDDLEHDEVYYILLQEKVTLQYLIKSTAFRHLFIEIN